MPGQQRNIQNVTNAFATAHQSPTAAINWTQQYGGADGQSTGAGLAIDPSGSSVLDALGLPRGTIDLNQSVDLTAQTTLRAGDSFQIKIEGAAPRTATITIDQGETLDSLATKINAQLGGDRQGGGQLHRQCRRPEDHGQSRQHHRPDCRARPISTPWRGWASPPARSARPPPAAPSTSSAVQQPRPAIARPTGWASTGTLDISTKTGADLARSQLAERAVEHPEHLSEDQRAAHDRRTAGNTSGTASAATTAQLASYNLALSLLGTDANSAVANIQSIVASSGAAVAAAASSQLAALAGDQRPASHVERAALAVHALREANGSTSAYERADVQRGISALAISNSECVPEGANQTTLLNTIAPADRGL